MIGWTWLVKDLSSAATLVEPGLNAVLAVNRVNTREEVTEMEKRFIRTQEIDAQSARVRYGNLQNYHNLFIWMCVISHFHIFHVKP